MSEQFILNLCAGSGIGFSEYQINNLTMKLNINKSDHMTDDDLYLLLVNICDDMSSLDTNYSRLGAFALYIKTQNQINKLGLNTFSSKVAYINRNLPDFLNPDYVGYIEANSLELNKLVENINLPDFIDLFSYRTLEGSYLLKVNSQIIEQPADMFLRVCVAIHMDLNNSADSIKQIQKMFYSVIQGLYTHATPTLYNAGTKFSQLSSCYLLGTDDSLDGIFKTFHDAAKISKWSGGIGIHISNIRATGSRIAGTNGESSGIIPMLKCYNDIARYINQGGRGKKRPGAIAIYLEPWHADILNFLELKLNTGADELRTRDLFLALWVPDLFMKQLEADADWYLMCPKECPGLADVYGEEFEKLYWSYVNKGLFKEKIKASEILIKITKSLGESGGPYILYKDHINRKSNQKNIGTIKSSNLCSEICQVSDSQSYAVCNLASIAVNKFINFDGSYNFEKLKEIAYELTINLNKVIDINYYPTPETKKSNQSTRPIGIGIQGMGDLLLEMRLPYESNEAIELEGKIMETIYYGAVSSSCDQAKIFGSYERFDGSPFSQGILQFDMDSNVKNMMWDWDKLKLRIKEFGMRNSLLTALMPTASTSQILGNMECFEPITSNLYSRKTSVGVFKIINKHLIKDLEKLNLWSEAMKNKIILENGSIQKIPEIPSELKQLYKTVWEIKQKSVIDHALARQPFVDQSQSMNLYFEKIEISKVKNALFYGWKRGIKTGCYYMKSEPASQAASVIAQPDNKVSKIEYETCETCSA